MANNTLSAALMDAMINSTIIPDLCNFSDCSSNETAKPYWYTPLEKAHRITITSTLVFSMFAMGCAVEVSVVLHYLKRPWPVLVGIFSQFGILPCLAFGLVNAIGMDHLFSLGCIIVSCSPGGGSSNMYTYWVDGNVSLSIVMTTISTTLAFVLMPLNIFIYTRLWAEELTESAISGSPFSVVPYEKIFTALACALGPVILGVLVRRWNLKVANAFAKIGSLVSILMIWIFIAMQVWLYEWHKTTMWQLWVASITLPAVGFSCGFVMSKIFCQPKPVPRTVAFETGCQNMAVALSVIARSFPNDIVKKVIIFPILYGVFTQVVAIIPIAIYQIYKFIFPVDEKELARIESIRSAAGETKSLETTENI